MSFIPQQFGAYQLIRRLGVGGMAETFLAVRRGLSGFEQHLCVKRILPAFEEDEEFVRLFLQEARLAARLRHTHIVQVIDFGEVSGQHYLSLELIEGLDLRNLLKAVHRDRKHVPYEVVAHIAVGVANALEYAHTERKTGINGAVFHRDVSPSNVLVSYAGEIKLTDFGIAKAAGQGQATQSGIIKGKLPYLPPEYLISGQFDARGDLYALGVMLYECLTGVRPYDGQHEFETLQRSADGQHEPLADKAPDAHPEFIKAIEKLIRPKADERFQSAYEFLEALVPVNVSSMVPRVLGNLVRTYAPPANLQRSSAPPPPEPETPDRTMALEMADFESELPVPNFAGYSGPTRTHTPSNIVGHGPTRTHASAELRQQDAGAEREASSPVVEGALAAQAELAPQRKESSSAPKSGLSVKRFSAPPTAIDRPDFGAETRTSATSESMADVGRPSMRPAPRVSSKFAIAPPAAPDLAAMQNDDGQPAIPAKFPLPPTLPQDKPRQSMGKWAWLGIGAFCLVAVGMWLTANSHQRSTEVNPPAQAPHAPAQARSGKSATPSQPPTQAASVGVTTPKAPPTAQTPSTEPSHQASTAPTNGATSSNGAVVANAIPAQESADGRTEESKPRGSRLTVAVVPFGIITVDGTHKGPSPLTVNVAPGVHSVSVKGEKGVVNQTVTVKAGQRKKITVKAD